MPMNSVRASGSGPSRSGVGMQLAVVSVVIALVSIGASSAFRLRQGAQRALARSLAAGQVLAVAQSAMEETVFRVRHPEPGREILTADRPVGASVDPARTRQLLVGGRDERMTVEPVQIRQIGSTVTAAGRPAWGVLEMSASVTLGTGGLASPSLRRVVVRRYGFEILRVVVNSSGGPVPVFSQFRLAPEPLAEWVVP